jgi:TRAP-type C4-dicarboxylate transport system permease large subunit
VHGAGGPADSGGDGVAQSGGELVEFAPVRRRVVVDLQPLAVAKLLGLLAGIDPIHLGVSVIMALACGLITPPYGICVLIAAQIGAKVAKGEMTWG